MPVKKKQTDQFSKTSPFLVFNPYTEQTEEKSESGDEGKAASK